VHIKLNIKFSFRNQINFFSFLCLFLQKILEKSKKISSVLNSAQRFSRGSPYVTASHIRMCNFPRELFVRDKNITGSQLPLARLVRSRALSLLEKLPRVTYSTFDAAVYFRHLPRRRVWSTDFSSNVFQGGREGTVFLSPSISSSPFSLFLFLFSFLSLSFSLAHLNTWKHMIFLFLSISFSFFLYLLVCWSAPLLFFNILNILLSASFLTFCFWTSAS